MRRAAIAQRHLAAVVGNCDGWDLLFHTFYHHIRTEASDIVGLPIHGDALDKVIQTNHAFGFGDNRMGVRIPSRRDSAGFYCVAVVKV